MKKKVFFALAIIIIGYAIYDFRHDQTVETNKAVESQLYTANVDQIKTLSLKSPTEDFSLERTADGWKFTKPLNELADQDAVMKFLEGIGTEKSKSVAVEGATVDPKTFGMSPPAAEIKLLDNLGVTHTFTVSSRKNFQNDSFLTKDNEKKIYVVSSTWAQKAAKTKDDFRDRRWARINVAKIKDMHWVRGRETFEIKKEDGVWKASKAPDLHLDQEKIRMLVGRLSGRGFQSFDVDLKTAKVGASMVTWVVDLDDGTKWQGDFYVSKDKKNYIHSEPPGMSGEVLTDDANAVYKVTLEELRDKKEPFHFSASDVKKATIRLKNRNLTLEKTEKGWVMPAGAATHLTLNEEKFRTVLYALSQLEITDFDPKIPKPFEFKNDEEVTLLNEAGKAVFDMKFQAQDKEKYVAWTNLYGKEFTLSNKQIKDLQLDEVATEDSAAATAK